MRASQTPILIIESGEITLNNPVRSGYTFVSWTGTELTEPALVVNIPAGSTGEREYTAVREKENSGETTADEDTPPESSSPSDNGSQPPSYNNPSTSDEDNSVLSKRARQPIMTITNLRAEQYRLFR